jgi:hypothetical protein
MQILGEIVGSSCAAKFFGQRCERQISKILACDAVSIL